MASGASNAERAATKPWPVELRLIIFLEPIEAQADRLAARIAEDMRVVGPVTWALTPGWQAGIDERGALTIFCSVLAAGDRDAALVADEVVDLAVGSLISDDPPGLLLPVFSDPRVGPR